MSKIGQALSEREIPEPQEPEAFEKQYLSPEDEKAFEEWAKRLVPAHLTEPF